MGTSPVIEPLGSHHDRAAFSCGNEDLDRYFHRLASQDLRRGVAVPFVLIEPTASNIAGFYTLSALSVRIGAFPESITRKLPKISGDAGHPSRSAGSRSAIPWQGLRWAPDHGRAAPELAAIAYDLIDCGGCRCKG